MNIFITMILLLTVNTALWAQPLDIRMRLNKSTEQTFYQGEKILITFDATQDCFVHVIYQDASGERYLIYPNGASRPEGKVKGRQRVTIGRGVNIDGYEFEVVAPYGGELIRAYASTNAMKLPDGEELDGGMLRLPSTIDQLDLFYQEQAEKSGGEFTTATLLLKTAARGEQVATGVDGDASRSTDTDFAVPRIYGLVIGVSKYAHGNIESLRYADDDARLMAEFLQSPNGGSLPPEQLRILLNEQADRAGILNAFSSFLGRTGKDDIVIIHIAAHGLAAPQFNATYFLGYDSDLDRLPETAVDQSELTALLTDRIKAGKIILFVDACHGGGLGLTGVKYRGAPSDLSGKLLTELVSKKNGTAFFSASRARERSQESARWGGGHGVFTYYLVKGLQHAADADKDGKVSINELAEYVNAKVRDDTKGMQHPELKGYFDNDLVLSVLK